MSNSAFRAFRRTILRIFHVIALDASATAVIAAKRTARDLPRVAVRTAGLPNELPRSLFYLIVIYELLYHLLRDASRRLLAQAGKATVWERQDRNCVM